MFSKAEVQHSILVTVKLEIRPCF